MMRRAVWRIRLMHLRPMTPIDRDCSYSYVLALWRARDCFVADAMSLCVYVCRLLECKRQLADAKARLQREAVHYAVEGVLDEAWRLVELRPAAAPVLLQQQQQQQAPHKQQQQAPQQPSQGDRKRASSVISAA